MTMEILGRVLTPAFERFHEDVKAELDVIDISYEAIQADDRTGGRRGLGGYWGLTQFAPDLKSATIRLALNIGDGAFSHTAGHEHAHVLQRLRKYADIQVPIGWGTESQQAKVTTTFSEAIECVAIDELLMGYGLDPSYSRQVRIQKLTSDVESVKLGPASLDSPRFIRSVLRYVRTALENPEVHWKDLETSIRRTWPDVTSLGDRMIIRPEEIGRTTRSQRRQSFLYLQDELGLRGRVVINDPETGRQR